MSKLLLGSLGNTAPNEMEHLGSVIGHARPGTLLIIADCKNVSQKIPSLDQDWNQLADKEFDVHSVSDSGLWDLTV